MKKIKLATFLLSAILFVVVSDRLKGSPKTTPLWWVVGRGGLSFSPLSRVARLAEVPSIHVNRPLQHLTRIKSYVLITKLLRRRLECIRQTARPLLEKKMPIAIFETLTAQSVFLQKLLSVLKKV